MCELAQAYRSTIRKARKPHRCCECEQEIPTGQKYRYDSGVFDHEPFSYKRCLSCYDLMEFVQQLPEFDCLDVDVVEYLRDYDYIDDQPHDEEDEHGSYCSIASSVPWLKHEGGKWCLAVALSDTQFRLNDRLESIVEPGVFAVAADDRNGETLRIVLEGVEARKARCVMAKFWKLAEKN